MRIVTDDFEKKPENIKDKKPTKEDTLKDVMNVFVNDLGIDSKIAQPYINEIEEKLTELEKISEDSGSDDKDILDEIINISRIYAISKEIKDIILRASLHATKEPKA